MLSCRLGLDHLVGTPALKPYMHGYFISLKLYDTARVIANPFAYAEHREKIVREKMEKMAETRIRAKKEVGVKVNKALAEKILRDEEKAKKREERMLLKRAERENVAMDVDVTVEEEGEKESNGKQKPSLLNDPRFSKLFEDPEFAIDEDSREFALMNPSAAAGKRNGSRRDGGANGRMKTAVEEEEEESDKASSDGLGDSDSDGSDNDSSDSSDAGGKSFLSNRTEGAYLTRRLLLELNKFDPRARPGQKNTLAQEAYTRNRERNRIANVNLVPMRAQAGANSMRPADKNATFGQLRGTTSSSASKPRSSRPNRGAEGGMEMSWVPSSREQLDNDDMLVPGGRGNGGNGKERRKGVEVFGAGLERGGEDRSRDMAESDRKGRTQRRKGVRNGSKNVFRRMDG